MNTDAQPSKQEPLTPTVRAKIDRRVRDELIANHLAEYETWFAKKLAQLADFDLPNEEEVADDRAYAELRHLHNAEFANIQAAAYREARS